MASNEEPEQTASRTWDWWRIAEAAAWATIATQALTTLVSVGSSNPTYRIPALAVGGGFLVLRAIILVGVRERASWALWCGAALALLFVAATPVLTQSVVQTPVGVVEVNTTGAITGWLTVLTSLALLVSCVMVLLELRRS